MKKATFILPCLLAVIVLLICQTALPTTAEAATSGYFTYDVLDGRAIITDCDTSVSGDVTIPETLDGCPVTGIGISAFKNCTGITGVTIPDSVTDIGDYAFNKCSSLESIAIPDNVTSIGNYAFYGCTGLTSATIGDGVLIIGSYAFNGCTSLSGIWVAESNQNYSSDAYGVLFNKDKTTLIRVPAGYSGSYTIPNSVSYIGDYAFSGCGNMTAITVGDSVTGFGYCAFDGCDGLTDVYITNLNAWLDLDSNSPARYADNLHILDASGQEVTQVVLDDSVTSIPSYAFSGCRNLTGITIPDSVTSIGSYAFSDCTGLTGVTIPSSVTSIGSCAFSNCIGLTGIDIPDSVTDVGERTFYGCTGLTGVTIGDGLTNIAYLMFSGCTSLADITIGNGVTYIDNAAFYGCTNLNYNAYGNAEYLGNEDNPYLVLVQSKSDSITSCNIHANTRIILYSVFNYCASLKTVIIPAGVTNIGSEAFRNCDSLTDVYYAGTEAQWSNVIVGVTNYDLSSATMHYNFAGVPVGDFNTDVTVSDADAIYLLRYTLFPDTYPLNMDGDVNSDGTVNDADAIYLLRYTLFPGNYPLYPTKESE